MTYCDLYRDESFFNALNLCHYFLMMFCGLFHSLCKDLLNAKWQKHSVQRVYLIQGTISVPFQMFHFGSSYLTQNVLSSFSREHVFMLEPKASVNLNMCIRNLSRKCMNAMCAVHQSPLAPTPPVLQHTFLIIFTFLKFWFANFF